YIEPAAANSVTAQMVKQYKSRLACAS
ncbi:hypothetical protein D021_2756B, partial [Vibrio parahaemolyticus 10296]